MCAHVATPIHVQRAEDLFDELLLAAVAKASAQRVGELGHINLEPLGALESALVKGLAACLHKIRSQSRTYSTQMVTDESPDDRHTSWG